MERSDSGLSRAELLKRAGVFCGVALAGPGALAACDLGSDSDETQPGGTPASGIPRRGGTLRVGFIGGGAAETLDPNAAVSIIDSARATNLFDPLVTLNPDLSLSYQLAESMEPNSRADEWLITLRSGVTWHDGSPLTPEDVIFTFKRIDDPKGGLSGKEATRFIDFARLRKDGPRRLRVPLVRANAEFPSFFTIPYWRIVKAGSTNFDKPVGTGPFKVTSFKAGQQSRFARYGDYWQDDKPYVDQLVMLSIPDQTARLNALLGGQIDAMESLSFTQARAEKEGSRVQVLEAQGSNIVPIYMAVDTRPFDDPRVREAMRLLADRKALLDAAQLGLGEIGNDVYGKGLPFYNDSLEQREADPERARSLLKTAGQEDLRVTLHSSTAAAGMLESAQAFAEQAKAAGVSVSVKNEPADQYFGDLYLTQSFAQSLWFTEPIVGNLSKALVKGAPFNETRWNSARFQQTYDQLLAELDEERRGTLYDDLQQQLWNDGGYLIWGFFPLLDGLSKEVRGVVANPAQPLGNYDFKSYWLE